MAHHWEPAGNVSRTLQINFGRTGAVARTTLSTVGGVSRCSTGITSFRTRPDPNGPDIETNLPRDFGLGFVPIIAQNNMTSVTAIIDTQNATIEFGIGTLNALAVVGRRAAPVKNELAVLHVDPATDTSKPYRVDHDRRTLTAYESPGVKQ
jgi:hypothetical protein